MLIPIVIVLAVAGLAVRFALKDREEDDLLRQHYFAVDRDASERGAERHV